MRRPSELRPGLPPLPRRMHSLPLDHRGYPVPYFVRWTDGTPDFRIADTEKWTLCVREMKCWICGQRLGKWQTFVVGPMCTVNRTTGEPPCHYDCARFAACACPFLALPKAKRNNSNIPDGIRAPPGEHSDANPGVTALWSTQRRYALMSVDGDYLIQMAPVEQLEWYTQGRPATETEAIEAVKRGVIQLREAAKHGGEESISSFEAWMLDGSLRHPILAKVLGQLGGVDGRQ